MGRKGQKKGRQTYDPEFRAAVMASLLAGQGVTAVARQYRLSTSTVSRWKREARAQAGKSNDVGALLLNYLQSALETLTAQLKVLGDPDYVREQPAGEAAVLHGVLADKVVRLIEAMEAPGND